MRFNTVFTGSALLLGYGVFAATVSQNTRCGKDFGGLVCPGSSSSVGPCCSQYGWCGRTENHCYVSSGCQSGFGSCSTSSGSKQPPTSSPLPAPSNLKTSTNGKCGAGSSQTCLSSVFGNCCSQYGYCGSSNSYCGTGCQTKFGSCKDTPSSPSSIVVPPSSAIANPIASASATSQRVSTNARCGASFGGQTCKGSKWGNCCSQYSYCGSTDAYCAPETCQKGFGDCNVVSSSSTAPASTTSHSSAETSSIITSSTITSSTSDPAVTPEAVSSSPSSSPTISLETSSSASSETSTSVSVSSSELVSSSTSTTSTITSTEASSTTSEIASTTTTTLESSSTSPTPTPSPSPPEPSQLLPNSDFEGATSSPWILFPADATIAAPSDLRYGSKSVRVTRRGGLFASVRQSVPITVAGSYTASFSVKVDGTVGVPCYISLTGYIEKAYGQIEVQEWTKFSETTTLSAGGNNFVRIVVSCSQVAQTGSVWFDDITLTRVG